MELTIITPKRTQTHTIAWVEVNTTEGNFVIKPGHAPIIAILAPDQPLIFCLITGKQESFLIPQGILETTRTHVTVLINDAV